MGINRVLQAHFPVTTKKMNKYFECWKCHMSIGSFTFTEAAAHTANIPGFPAGCDQPSSPWQEPGHWPTSPHHTGKPLGTPWRTAGTLPSIFLCLAREGAWGPDAMQSQSPSSIVKCFRRPNISVTLNDTFPSFKTDSKKENLEGF